MNINKVFHSLFMKLYLTPFTNFNSSIQFEGIERLFYTFLVPTVVNVVVYVISFFTTFIQCFKQNFSVWEYFDHVFAVVVHNIPRFHYKTQKNKLKEKKKSTQNIFWSLTFIFLFMCSVVIFTIFLFFAYNHSTQIQTLTCTHETLYTFKSIQIK